MAECDQISNESLTFNHYSYYFDSSQTQEKKVYFVSNRSLMKLRGFKVQTEISLK